MLSLKERKREQRDHRQDGIHHRKGEQTDHQTRRHPEQNDARQTGVLLLDGVDTVKVQFHDAEQHEGEKRDSHVHWKNSRRKTNLKTSHSISFHRHDRSRSPK